MKSLLEARQYENQFREVDNIEKPVFHVSAPVGWINDPNGFSRYQNAYHLFFQYYPYDTHWGPMHWGHCKTEDFVKWNYLPAALAPDKGYDQDGCFSGSAMEDDNRHILVYTGVKKDKGADGKREVRQVQCIASGDGVDYEKWDCNPIVTADMVEEQVSTADFRDPKIWKHGDTYYMIVGCCDENKHGRIALFSSDNLTQWNYERMLAVNDGSLGRMWECPDFFELNGYFVLLVSPQDMELQGLEFHNGNGTAYYIGEFNYSTKIFEHGEARAIDYGLDFYAPQTMLDSQGRRIMIGWMQSWDNKLIPEEQQWNGMMTIPRELQIQDGKLIQRPVKELETYYSDKVEYKAVELEGVQELSGVEGRVLNLEVDVLEGDYKSLEIQLAKNDKYMVKCKYETETGIFSFDRTYAGLRRDVLCKRKMKVSTAGHRIKLRIVMDKYSAEIFINQGEQVMSSVFYTTLDAQGIVFLVDGRLTADIVKHNICIE